MKFSYAHLRTKRPVYSLGGTQFRDRPIIPVELKGPRGTRHIDCSLDPGSDDTLFPAALARVLGIPLTQPPDHGEALAIGGAALSYAYGHVRLRISDGFEACEWDAIVGFIDVPLVWPLLGLAGVLQFFDASLLGASKEAILVPNAAFSGTVTRRTPSP